MSSYVEQLGLHENMWDAPRILRNPTNEDSEYKTGAQLSPTAVNPAVWVFHWINGIAPYTWQWFFSTDTAIAWTLFFISVNPGLTALTAGKLGNTSGSSALSVQGAVAAAPAVSGFFNGGYAAAGSYFDILQGRCLKGTNNSGMALVTSAVAANCFSTWRWSEYAA